jgi:nitroimidazol reductase NimA-like FMN-containing flavoprotein (pyridoxamine 5'-phosphate oxidase superfamily)
MIETLNNEVESKIKEIMESNNAIMLATTGTDYSPWILGAYFVSEGLDIYLLLEKGGKSFANISANKNVAYSISQNDATKDFLQGKAVVEVLPDTEEAKVRDMLLKKMPWYQTFVPMVPVKITASKLFVTSLQNGWFPAKVLENMN